MTDLPVRSALYMPASRPRLLQKAATLACDALIVDLEDSVAPETKAQARRNAVEALGQTDYGSRVRVLRVNGADTCWHLDDIAAAGEARPDALLLPKTDDGDAVQRFCDRLDAAGLPANVRVWAMLETPAALLALPGFARVAGEGARLHTFCIGNNDLAKAARMPEPTSRATLQPWLLSFLACARANGLAILDGVFNDFGNATGFEQDCQASAACGFDGRTLIHPTQIDAANEAFSPDASQVEQARRIVALFERPEHAAAGAVALDGRMVERLHLDTARRTLQLAERDRPIPAGAQP